MPDLCSSRMFFTSSSVTFGSELRFTLSFTTNSGRKAKTGMGALLQVVNFFVFVFGVTLVTLFIGFS